MIRRIASATALLLGTMLLNSCGEQGAQPAAEPADRVELPIIQSRQELNRVISEADDRLLLIDFFADWCLPCKQLEPILEEIARKAKDRVSVYRIDLDANQHLANGFEVQGIPYVVFVKNRTIVYKLMGLHPKQTYWEAVHNFSSKPDS